MISWPLKYACALQSMGYVALFSFFTGCGAVGSPIPPEDIGIAAKVRKQQQENAQPERARSEDGVILVEEESVELPVFYPIGTR